MKYLTDFEKTFSNFVFNLWKELKVLDMKNPNNPALSILRIMDLGYEPKQKLSI